MSAPLVTIATVYYNRAAFVRPSIDSLLAQTADDLQILLIDDGSTDDTRAALGAYARDPRVTIVSAPNQGFTRAIAGALSAHARGEYIAIHGSGDFSYPFRIEEQLTMLEQHREHVAVGCWVDNHYENGHIVPWHRRIRPVTQDDLLQQNYFTHGEVMFRRAVYEQVGGYRPAFRFSQDYDLWLRITGHGTMGVVPSLLYKRYVRSDGVQLNIKQKTVQAFMAAGAVENARLRRRTGTDCVDAFGADGIGMARRSDMQGRILFGYLRHLEHRPALLDLLWALTVANLSGPRRWLGAMLGRRATTGRRPPVVLSLYDTLRRWRLSR